MPDRDKNSSTTDTPVVSQIDTIAIIGIGLIGSSITRAVRAKELVRRIVVYDASEQVRARAIELKLQDEVCDTLACAVRQADLTILCVPVGAYEACALELAQVLKPGSIVSDVGSVKGVADKVVAPLLPNNVHFVPAHPVAGTEYSGPDAGFASLFENRWCILTPNPRSNPAAVDLVRRLWSGMGANVEIMAADHHDLVLAITSHVPHLIAYNIVGTAADLEEVTQSEVIKFSAGGFRDFTRIAASDPTMWRDVFLNNKDAVLEMLGRFTEDLTALQRMIRRGDGDGLFDLFTRTRAIRRSIIEQGQETAAPDFGRQAATKPPEGQ